MTCQERGFDDLAARLDKLESIIRSLGGPRANLRRVEQAKGAGRRKPPAITRWILKQPFRAGEVFNRIDVEGLLAARIEELERERES